MQLMSGYRLDGQMKREIFLIKMKGKLTDTPNLGLGLGLGGIWLWAWVWVWSWVWIASESESASALGFDDAVRVEKMSGMRSRNRIDVGAQNCFDIESQGKEKAKTPVCGRGLGDDRYPPTFLGEGQELF